jgi:hypothetical protein
MEQWREGGRDRPDLRQGGPTPVATTHDRAPGRGTAELLRGVLCMPMSSLPLCRPPRAYPSPQPPSPPRLSWWVISRDATFLHGERGIQPNVARVEMPSTAPGVTRRMASRNGTTLSPNLATQGPSIGKNWVHPLVAAHESA